MRREVAKEEDGVDAAVLAMLLAEDAQRPWSLDEVALELGDRLHATDALNRLQAAGLVHRVGDFVFAARAALHAARLQL